MRQSACRSGLCGHPPSSGALPTEHPQRPHPRRHSLEESQDAMLSTPIHRVAGWQVRPASCAPLAASACNRPQHGCPAGAEPGRTVPGPGQAPGLAPRHPVRPAIQTGWQDPRAAALRTAPAKTPCSRWEHTAGQLWPWWPPALERHLALPAHCMCTRREPAALLTTQQTE
jgi:hypothetical protein